MIDTPSSADDEGHYYLAGYSAGNDPYVYPNGVLINTLGIQNTADLNEAEADFSTVRLIQLQESPLQGGFDLQHLCAIHHFIFQDIYPWAGEVRRVDIGKNDTSFVSHPEIVRLFGEVTHRLASTGFFDTLGGDAAAFSKEAGVILGRINFIHAFREGNGRAQREFLDALALRAGFMMEWAGVSKQAMKDACVEAIADPDCKKLARLIWLSVKAL